MSSVFAGAPKRRTPRFLLRPPVEATFGASNVQVVDISLAGALLETEDRALLDEIRELWLHDPFTRSIESFPARVVWSKVHGTSPSGALLYKIGIEFQPAVDAESVIEDFLRTGGAIAKDDSLDPTLLHQKSQVVRIESAKDFFRKNPDQIAVYSKNMRAAGVAKNLANRDQIFAVWELLERTVDLELVKKLIGPHSFLQHEP